LTLATCDRLEPALVSVWPMLLSTVLVWTLMSPSVASVPDT
jgi:hypothetical protein